MNLSFFLKPGLYVSKETVIKGSVITDANIYVAGTINGDAITQAMITIEKSGLITGDVQAKNVIVKGKIKGNVKGSEKVDVIKGEIDGHIDAPEVNVDTESLVKGDITKLGTANFLDTNDAKAELSGNINSVTPDKPVKEEEKPQSWF